jgi:RND family efflux transporter MFP subunit
MKVMFIKYKPLLFFIAIIIIAALVFIFVSKNGDYELLEVKKSDFVKVVEVTGKVIPANEVDLAFEVGGRVRSVNYEVGDPVKRGDVIVSLDSSKKLADLDKALADLEVKEVELTEVSSVDAYADRLNKQRTLSNEIIEGFTNVDVAIRDNTDQMFDDPDGSASVTLAINNYFTRESIDDKRRQIEDLLEGWQDEISDLNENSVLEADYVLAINNLTFIRDYLRLLASGLSDSKEYRDVTETVIVRYKNAVSSARSSVESSIQSVTAAYEDLKSLDTDQSIKEAQVRSANAGISSIEADLRKLELLAPFAGVVSNLNLEVGEIVGANQEVVSVISNRNFEIEAFVPEVNISKVKKGSEADFTLDAFDDSQTFKAEIVKIDPRETVKDGISTYKVSLRLKEKYEEIKPGMTANISIVSSKKTNQILIPRSEIEVVDGVSYVYLYKTGEIVRTSITTGQTDGSGNIEVRRGLKVGDLLVLNHSE